MVSCSGVSELGSMVGIPGTNDLSVPHRDLRLACRAASSGFAAAAAVARATTYQKYLE